MKKILTPFVAVFAFCFLTGFLGADGDNPDEKRANIQKMKDATLADLYKYHPDAKQSISNAIGYAVFSNTGINLLLLSTGNGWGVAHHNGTSKETYMKMFTAGVGIGLGVKDFRGIFVFTSQDAFDNFVEHGWQAGAQGDAAAKAGEKGGAADAAFDVAPGVVLYQLTENGLALQATVQGYKYWKDDDLNEESKDKK